MPDHDHAHVHGPGPSKRARLALSDNAWPSAIQDLLKTLGDVDDGERAAATALMMGVHSTVSKLARALDGGKDEEQAEQLTGEYLRFMILLAEEQPQLADGQPSSLSPSPLIEQLWCRHLLETHSYVKMCACLVPEGDLIHHTSLRSSATGRQERVQAAVQAYRKRFHAAPPQAVWGVPEEVPGGVGANAGRQGAGSVRVGVHVDSHNPPANAEPEQGNISNGLQRSGQGGLQGAEWREMNSSGGAGCAADRGTAGPCGAGTHDEVVELEHVFVKTLTGRTDTVILPSLGLTMGEFKKFYQEISGVPPDEQRFFLANRQFPDTAVLRQIGIISGSMLHLVYRLKGC